MLLGDDIIDSKTKPCLKQLIDVYDKYNTTILGVKEVEIENVYKYGVVSGKYIGEGVYKAKDLVEKPNIKDSLSNIAILGRYTIAPDIFDIL